MNTERLSTIAAAVLALLAVVWLVTGQHTLGLLMLAVSVGLYANVTTPRSNDVGPRGPRFR